MRASKYSHLYKLHSKICIVSLFAALPINDHCFRDLGLINQQLPRFSLIFLFLVKQNIIDLTLSPIAPREHHHSSGTKYPLSGHAKNYANRVSPMQCFMFNFPSDPIFLFIDTQLSHRPCSLSLSACALMNRRIHLPIYPNDESWLEQ